MSKREKTIQRMKNNPDGWRIADCQALADHYGVDWVHDGTSHCVFDFGDISLSVPAKRPILPIYIKNFIRLLDECRDKQQGENK